MNTFNRLALFLSQVLFSIITPFLLLPRIAKLKATRSFISFCFGRAYGSRYDSIIDSYEGRYGSPMANGLRKAQEITRDRIRIVADCGTGTGFVTKQAAEQFPDATFIAFDLLPGMLKQAQARCEEINADVFHVQADNFALPLPDGSVDLLLVQNTMPCFSEFARVCRPGGIIIYVDSSAGWISGMVKRLMEKQRLFVWVTSERVDMGFCVVAKKDGDAQIKELSVKGRTKEERLANLLCCPIDKSTISIEQHSFICERGHTFPVHDGFPVMIR